MGIVQLSRLDALLEARRQIARRYHEAFEGLGLSGPNPGDEHIFYRYVIQPPGEVSLWLRELRHDGVGGERPVHLPLHRYLHRKDCPATERAWQRCLSLPIYPSLTDHEAERVIESVHRVIRLTSSRCRS
jgi:dTDP-4-amino-4,6-dideoxygalactose transaminase